MAGHVLKFSERSLMPSFLLPFASQSLLRQFSACQPVLRLNMRTGCSMLALPDLLLTSLDCCSSISTVMGMGMDTVMEEEEVQNIVMVEIILMTMIRTLKVTIGHLIEEEEIQCLYLWVIFGSCCFYTFTSLLRC